MTGKYHGHLTNKDGSHTLLSEAQAQALWEASERARKEQARLMPTAEDALRVIISAEQRLRTLGWTKGQSLRVPRDSQCAVAETGSTGIWSGWVDAEGEYVHYAGGVSKPQKLWLKPLDDLSDDVRSQLERCDKDAAEWAEQEFRRWHTGDD